MCGIFAIVRAAAGGAPTAPVLRATHVVRHRGPDDEGYLLWDAGAPRVHAGPDTTSASRRHRDLHEMPEHTPWRVAFGHRRLSIVDLSPNGHQPMVHASSGLAISYNGEIYNHIELRRELEARGHRFLSASDTEVLLAAWSEWGASCLDRLNGMFAFVLLDPRSGTVYAVRDRFGVKPLYYYTTIDGDVAFASEIKQLRSLPGFEPRLDRTTAVAYLAEGRLDGTRATFDDGIHQLMGGEIATIELRERALRPSITRWYTLPIRTFRGSNVAATREFVELFTDSVRLRLRADVPVGSCLSGGLDSSAIVCLVAQLLRQREAHAGQVTVTARFAESRFDEWSFASQVIAHAGASAIEVWPTLDRMVAELDRQLWHMDEPFGSTSQFSQACVFDSAARAGLKVMLDGQGSDEQLAGYPGVDAALYTGFLRRGALVRLLDEASAFRRLHGALPRGQLLLAARRVWPALDRVLPARHVASRAREPWLRTDPQTASHASRDLADELEAQTLVTSLPVLLRYEDRNSMARSIEARVPFLDYRLVELLRGLPEHLRIRRGTTKVILREAMRGVLPEPVRDRRDKMGFVTPEELWLRGEGAAWFRDQAMAAVDAAPDLLDGDGVRRLLDDMIAGATPFSFAPWRILCFGRWLRQLETADIPLPIGEALHA